MGFLVEVAFLVNFGYTVSGVRVFNLNRSTD